MMHVLAARFDVRFPSSQSLKEKRSLLRPLVDGARHRFGITIAEVDHQNTWQRSALGVAVVSASVAQATKVVDDVERYIWSRPDLEILDVERWWLDDG